MGIEESRRELDVIKQRYPKLELSDDQANLVIRFEQENAAMSGKESFTDFEESDYQSWFFGRILRPEQYAVFEKDRKRQLQRAIKEISKEDIHNELNVSWTERRFHYYKVVLLPALLNIPLLAVLFQNENDRSKIDFLRNSYRIFLSERKKKLLVNHFRYNRMYNSGRLELGLKQLELCYLWPDYSAFKRASDSVTRNVCEYLEEKAGIITEPIGEHYFGDTLKGLKAFYSQEEERRKKIIVQGWHITIPDKRTEIEKNKELGMQVLLCDRTAYGLVPEGNFGDEVKEA